MKITLEFRRYGYPLPEYMGTENSSNPPLTDTPESGRIPRPASAASQTGFWKWLPGLYVLRHYRLGWLRSDLVAGLVLTAVLVPVGMGYATAAGLPAIYGLYATIVPLLVYAAFGPSRTLVLGPDSSLAAIIFAVIVPLAAGDPDRTIALAGMLAVFTGLLCILAGLLRLGFHHRAALKANSLWLYERYRPDCAGGAASKAFWLLCRGGQRAG